MVSPEFTWRQTTETTRLSTRARNRRDAWCSPVEELERYPLSPRLAIAMKASPMPMIPTGLEGIARIRA